jgi:hypothetical protein
MGKEAEGKGMSWRTVSTALLVIGLGQVLSNAYGWWAFLMTPVFGAGLYGMGMAEMHAIAQRFMKL